MTILEKTFLKKLKNKGVKNVEINEIHKSFKKDGTLVIEQAKYSFENGCLKININLKLNEVEKILKYLEETNWQESYE